MWGICVSLCMYIQGQNSVSFSIIIHLIFETSSVPESRTHCLTRPPIYRDLCVSSSSKLGSQDHSNFLSSVWSLRIWTQALMLTQQPDSYWVISQSLTFVILTRYLSEDSKRKSHGYIFWKEVSKFTEYWKKTEFNRILIIVHKLYVFLHTKVVCWYLRFDKILPYFHLAWWL